MENSAAESAAIGQILCPRRQITLLEFTSKYQAEFPCAESRSREGIYEYDLRRGLLLDRTRRVRMRNEGRVCLYIFTI